MGSDEVTAAWGRFEDERRRLADATLRALFEDEPDRAARMAFEAAGAYADLSKHRVDAAALDALLALAEASGLRTRTEQMFTGEHVNHSEDRPALHTALRAPRGTTIEVDGVDVVPGVHRTLERMAAFADAVRSGRRLGATGRPIRNVVNLGIGGSHLGPMMMSEALRPYYADDLVFRFVANVDPANFVDQTRGLDPAETLFVVVSKSFGTAETLANAATARRWIEDGLGDAGGEVARHFVAVSSDSAAATKWGVAAEDVFDLPEWVGGRYSISSAVGLTGMVGLGEEQFRAFLAGMHAMDVHFRDQGDLARNVPTLMAMLSVWYVDGFGTQSTAVLPYADRLRDLPAYLQQLTMESNGKRVQPDGSPVDHRTAPVMWGGAGTDGQHSFHQLLHQGTVLVPCDFHVFRRTIDGDAERHTALVANALAQSQALAFGRTAEELVAEGVPSDLAVQRSTPGNQPSTTIVFDRLDPHTLGVIVALYEHITFVQGVVWGIDSFDQWGVQLGKQLAPPLVTALDTGEVPSSLDASTRALVERVRGGAASG